MSRGLTRVPLALLVAVALSGCLEGPPSAARVRYNAGVAALAAGKLDEATTAFIEARSDAGYDAELRFKAAFNLGMAYAKQGEAAAAEGEQHDADHAIAQYRQATAWFSDAKRLRAGDAETQANLERVQARILALVDEANQGENGLERRLEKLIEGERGLRDTARGLWQAQEGRAAASPLADKEPFERASTQQRLLGAEAGVVADLTGDEITAIGGKAEAQRTDDEQRRVVQLQNLDLYVQDARKEMTDARRNLAELGGELAYRRTEGALAALKRAREQLLDPVTVLRGVAQEHAELMGYTAQVDAARSGVRLPRMVAGGGSSPTLGVGRWPGEAPPAIPTWMEPIALGGQQLELLARLEEVRARLAAGAAAPDPAAPGAPQDPQKAAQIARVEAQITAALPAIEQASAAMRRASETLRGGDVKAGATAQHEALEAMARAIEQFLDLRGLIDLALAEQGAVVTALTPPAAGAPELSTAERARIVGDGATRNRARLERMQEMIATALAEATEAAQDDQGKTQAQELYGKAEALRSETVAALDQLLAVAAGGKGAPALETAATAHAKLEEMQRLFFSVIEHLKQLIRDQGDTRDQTAEAVTLDDVSRRPKLPGLVARETGHADFADKIAQALSAQADAAAQQPGPGQAAPQGGPNPASVREAVGEVRNALTSMQDAVETLTKAGDPNATMSFDLNPALDAQKVAGEHLENALRLLQPPSKKQQQDQQQQDQQQQPKDDKDKQDQQQQQQQQQAQKDQSKDEAERRLQQVREREAQRQREQHERQRIAPEPVDKDW